MATVTILTLGEMVERVMIDRTASTCVNPDMVYEGLINRCDGTTLMSIVQLLLPCENTLWQYRAERGQTPENAHQTATVGHQAAGMEKGLWGLKSLWTGFQYHQATYVQTKMTILPFISTVQTQLPFSLAAVGVQQTWLSWCCVLLWSCLDPS